MFGILNMFKSGKWHEGMTAKMTVCIADVEYRVSWNDKLDSTDEKKALLMEAVGDIIKHCLKVSSQHFNIMNPTLRDIDNNSVYIKSITTHKITPIFVVSTHADGVKTVIGVNDTYIEQLEAHS